VVPRYQARLLKKGAQPVISLNFRVFGEREINLQTAFPARNTPKGVFHQPQAITLKASSHAFDGLP